MELWEEMAHYVLQNPHNGKPLAQTEGLNALLETECYRALKRIKEIVENEALDDADCFERIEEVVRELERIGSNGGGRHDFS
ncbi:MAG: hypothetical protein IJW29_01545 [Clostridia bacterium]|nr:hypothetical protein [Clostridia bacterium]